MVPIRMDRSFEDFLEMGCSADAEVLLTECLRLILEVGIFLETY